MAITAALVKELRERTGAGMMECKKALVAANGDLDSAADEMRKSGLAKADKKAGRVAAEGLISIAQSEDAMRVALVEVNCETDFVAGGDDFKQFAQEVSELALKLEPESLDALLEAPMSNGEMIETVRRGLIAKIGENIGVRRFSIVSAQSGVVGFYSHGSRIGVAVCLKGGNEALARDVAMHVAASKPECIGPDDVSPDLLAKERAIIEAQSEGSGKPAEIIEKMVEGRIRKFLNEITLIGQPFVKDPDQSVGKLLKAANAEVVEFVRLEVGEGIEKSEDNFAEEVMAQVKGS